MPSVPHEALVQLIRDAPRLVEALLENVPAHDAVTSDTESLGEAVPRELRCDALVRFERAREAVLAAVVEVQLDEDPDKLFTWPAYAVNARLRLRCPTLVVVVTLSERVAEWARQTIIIGPTGQLTPVVFGPAELPAITDPAAARAAPELAVLSAIAHGRDRDAKRAASIATVAAGAALGVLKGERSALYYDLITASLSSAARKVFRMWPAGYEFQDEGLRNARAKGQAEGKAEGKLAGRAESILAVLEARALAVTEAQRERILASTDLTELDRWLRLAVTATSIDAVFKN
jgi:hypothetical protein